MESGYISLDDLCILVENCPSTSNGFEVSFEISVAPDDLEEAIERAGEWNAETVLHRHFDTFLEKLPPRGWVISVNRIESKQTRGNLAPITKAPVVFDQTEEFAPQRAPPTAIQPE